MSYLNSIDSVLEQDSTNNQPNKKKFAAMIAIGVMAGASLGLYLYNSSSAINSNTATTHPATEKALAENGIVNLAPKADTVLKADEVLNPIYETSKLINKENKAYLEKVGQFKLAEGLKDNQIARKVSQMKFEVKDYLSSLLSEGESYRSVMYADNIGLAIAYGLNFTMQSKGTMENLAQAISKDPVYIKKITALAGQSNQAAVINYDIKVTPQRGLQISNLIAEKFEDGLINVLGKKVASNPKFIALHKSTGKSYKELGADVYNNLAPNEKAAILYHTYKVGEGGFAKYTGLINALMEYSQTSNKTPELAKKVAEHLTYKYRINGEVKSDTRAEMLVQSMFMNPEMFGYIIAKNVAPKNYSSYIPAIKKYNIDVTVPSEKLIIPDPVGEYRDKMEKEGKPFKIGPVITELPIQQYKMDRPTVSSNHRFI